MDHAVDQLLVEPSKGVCVEDGHGSEAIVLRHAKMSGQGGVLVCWSQEFEDKGETLDWQWECVSIDEGDEMECAGWSGGRRETGVPCFESGEEG